MPGGLSVKLAGVLAAFAFAGAFRVEASRSDATEPAAPPIRSASTQAALASDVAPALAAGLPRLSAVSALPSLRKAPARHHAKHAVHAKAPVVHSVATPVPTTPRTTYTPPPAAPRTKKSYVGKSFDTNG